MFAVKLCGTLSLYLIICHVSYCQRRIVGGSEVTANKPYIVYLEKASLSERIYDSWICGGAIITSDFIITSAACVEDVDYLYAIAGYNKYVPDKQLDEDNCTSRMKKKIIFTCVPKSYIFDFDSIDKWSNIDIALARVESPYDFKNLDYEEYCSYIPTTIPINRDPKYQIPDTDCMVLGWGHHKKWRLKIDKSNNNSETLMYASTIVIEKDKCIEEYRYYPELKPIIEQYMICTLGLGLIDDGGEPFPHVLDPSNYTLLDECPPGRRMNQEKTACVRQNNGNQNTDFINTRRKVPKTNRTHHNYTTRQSILKAARERRSHRTRRDGNHGNCQNDHGGPLVTWVGTTEVLIGVASVFQIDEENNCIGPFLHTSTLNNAAFLDCVLEDFEKVNGRRQAGARSDLCDSPPSVRGFDMVENHISWKDHPAGPADNERPQAKSGPYNYNKGSQG